MKLQSIKIKNIITNPNQPRKYFDEEKLLELKESIINNGLIQPIVVRKIEETNKYEIVAGERRFRAVRDIGLDRIDTILINANDVKSYEFSVLENIQRENLSSIEEAESYLMLIEIYGYTQDKLAKKIGKTRSFVSNKLRLLKLPENVKVMVRKGELSYGHARTLLGLDDEKDIENLAKKIINKGYSVREVENLVKKYNTRKDKILRPPLLENIDKGDNNYRNRHLDSENLDNSLYENDNLSEEEKSEKIFLENKLEEHFESKVKIKGNPHKRGRIEIDYYSYEDLARIIELLNIEFE